ncbi:MAG: hypothetical protein GDA46_01110 [Bdellovibrionales bacterium]|nr:hypothetical protein [Bdellovibrionales bacterium]
MFLQDFSFFNKKKGQRGSQKGQALVEMAVISFVLIGFIQILLKLAWMFINLIWIEHQLYQAVLCLAQQKEKQICETILLRDIKKLNKGVKISSVNLSPEKGKLLWHFYKKDFLIKQDLKLPY